MRLKEQPTKRDYWELGVIVVLDVLLTTALLLYIFSIIDSATKG